MNADDLFGALDELKKRGGFTALGDGRYKLVLPMEGDTSEVPPVTFEVDYLRREGGSLKGQLIVSTTLPGARAHEGRLFAGDWNFSSDRTRTGLGRYLAERSAAEKLDWTGAVEQLAQRVIFAEKGGAPSVDLRTLDRPAPIRANKILGFPVLPRHPMVLFGDGGTAKSYLGLYIAGVLADDGVKVALFDWELCGEDHRDRLECLFGDQMPEIRYLRCERPLVYEVERIQKVIQEHQIRYAVFDSVAFACKGAPEQAEVASQYFQALRQLGEIGSLHIAHVTKSTESGDKRPFGSVFWHNGARSTWNIKKEEGVQEEGLTHVALHHRKVNLGSLQHSVGIRFRFEEGRTVVTRFDLSDRPALASDLSLRERVALALRKGPLGPDLLAEELDVEPAAIRGLGERYGEFVNLPGGEISLRFGAN